MEFCCQYVGGWGYPTSRGSVITIILSIGKVHGLRLTEVHVHLMMRITSRSLHSFCSEHVLPALCKTPTARSRPEGEGANLDRHLVPYHVKQGESNLASSLFIYLYASTVVLMRGIGILALVNSLQQKLILNYLN